jgi:hypothetical protein
MPRAQKRKLTNKPASTPAKAHVVLKGRARVLYETSRARSSTRHKELVESIRDAQYLTKEDYDLRMNTRD